MENLKGKYRVRQMKTIKCWGIPYGNQSNNLETEEITIEMKCKTIIDFKKKCKKEGHKLTGVPYTFKS